MPRMYWEFTQPPYPAPGDFLLRFPEFGEISTDVVDQALAASWLQTPENVWGEYRWEAAYHLTAHNLAMRSMQIGNQVGSPSGSPIGTDLQATLYGVEYKRMMEQLPLCGFAY